MCPIVGFTFINSPEIQEENGKYIFIFFGTHYLSPAKKGNVFTTLVEKA